MKKITTMIAVLLMLTSVLGGCRKATNEPVTSPNVPVVTESPLIPSPDLSPKESPAANGEKDTESPKPTGSPEADAQNT